MTADDRPEPFDLVSSLDEENERLRLRVLEVMVWMEEAVTEQVAQERRATDFERQAIALQHELDAIHQSWSWRLLKWPRSGYSTLRSVRGR